MEALNEYEGAVVLVSHDMHLLSLVADRLWLVSDGTVTPFEDDLESYRRFLLASDKPPPVEKIAQPKPKRASRDVVLALRSEVRKCEERLAKLTEMEEKLSVKLADPTIYEDDKVKDLETWNRKYAEVTEAIERAEALWMDAQEKLDAAEAG